MAPMTGFRHPGIKSASKNRLEELLAPTVDGMGHLSASAGRHQLVRFRRNDERWHGNSPVTLVWYSNFRIALESGFVPGQVSARAIHLAVPL